MTDDPPMPTDPRNDDGIWDLVASVPVPPPADDFMPTLPADSLGRRIVMLANWNEFGEGHFLMPSALAGFGYVDALREVFTAGGAHEDEVPTDAQKRRFTVLYPKD